MQDQRAVWDRIAASFDRSRKRTWPHVVDYLQSLPPGSSVLDLMCGNGRHTKSAIAAELDVISLDWSEALVDKVQSRYANGIVGDATKLPFASEQFDACIYVAGWHGIPSAEGRQESLRELHRVLRPGGTCQLTSWSRDAPRFQSKGEPGEPVDVMIPWRSDGHNEERTYHLTTMEYLRRECIAAGFKVNSSQEVAIVNHAPDNLVVNLTK